MLAGSSELAFVRVIEGALSEGARNGGKGRIEFVRALGICQMLANEAGRARVLASAMVSREWRVALCIPEGSSAAIPDDVSAQPVLVPTPFGMPRVIGRRMFPLAQRLGLNRRVSMTCFDDVLRGELAVLGGATRVLDVIESRV